MEEGPAVIGGIGGSGTRVFAAILKDLGFYLGDDLNRAHDNLWFTLLFKRQELWPPEDHSEELAELLRMFQSLMIDGTLPKDVDLNRVRGLALRMRPQHPTEWLTERVSSVLSSKRRMEAGYWGFKEPNSHIFLPAMIEAMGTMKYIHVVRHGVDMAFSGNQNQLKFWGRQMLGRKVDFGSPSDSLAYWCASHRRVIQLGSVLGNRFLMLNYDAFCLSPESSLLSLMEFLGSDDTSLVDLLIDKHVKPSSLSRYKSRDLSILSRADLDYVESLGFEI